MIWLFVFRQNVEDDEAGEQNREEAENVTALDAALRDLNHMPLAISLVSLRALEQLLLFRHLSAKRIALILYNPVSPLNIYNAREQSEI